MSDNKEKANLPSDQQYDIRSMGNTTFFDVGGQSYTNGILGASVTAAFSWVANSLLLKKYPGYGNIPKTVRFYFWTLLCGAQFFYWVEETEVNRSIDKNAKFAQSMLDDDEQRYFKHLEKKQAQSPAVTKALASVSDKNSI